jgi:hypothetical protein
MFEISRHSRIFVVIGILLGVGCSPGPGVEPPMTGMDSGVKNGSTPTGENGKAGTASSGKDNMYDRAADAGAKTDAQ